MKVGDLFQERREKFDAEWERKTIESAMKAFGHREGMTDIRALCLRISQLDRLAKERLANLKSASLKIRDLSRQIEMMDKGSGGDDEAI